MNLIHENISIDDLTEKEWRSIRISRRNLVRLRYTFETMAWGKVIKQRVTRGQFKQEIIGGRKVFTVQWHGERHPVQIVRNTLKCDDGDRTFLTFEMRSREDLEAA